MIDEERKMQMLWIAFEAWKFQIDAFWTRTSYFALFELAFGAGLWKVFESGHWFTSACMALGAILLTCIWIINNIKLHEYILYYSERVKHFEGAVGIDTQDTIFAGFETSRQNCFPGSYHLYIQGVPLIFIVGWFYMFVWSVSELHCIAHICG
jgi:hypothetical protein